MSRLKFKRRNTELEEELRLEQEGARNLLLEKEKGGKLLKKKDGERPTKKSVKEEEE